MNASEFLLVAILGVLLGLFWLLIGESRRRREQEVGVQLMFRMLEGQLKSIHDALWLDGFKNIGGIYEQMHRLREDVNEVRNAVTYRPDYFKQLQELSDNLNMVAGDLSSLRSELLNK
jgi:hypothetical protein